MIPTDDETHTHNEMPRELVPQLVGHAATISPEAIAWSGGARFLTYAELDGRANQLARHLRSLGAGPDVVVGLYLGRSAEMVVGALAILRAGGAYLPLDPKLPADRLDFILTNSQTPILITDSQGANRLPRGQQRKLVLSTDANQLDASPLSDCLAGPDNLAYVIYTSGSTGSPKGVEITHAGLLNLVNWHRRAFQVKPTDRSSQQAAVGFDAAVWEIWPYLCAGASIHMPEPGVTLQPEKLRDWLIAQEITIAFLPTALAERMLLLAWPEKVPLRVLLTGADTLHHRPSSRLPFTLVNNYGPTECTVVATSGIVTPGPTEDRLPSIGKPIDNIKVYLLDRHLQPVAFGEVGELCIAGIGLARGYLNSRELTAERFLPNPLCKEHEPRIYARIYRTGDLARYLPDGQLSFVGRLDEQVKIRGYRVEPAEIVEVLNTHPAVETSLVTSWDHCSGERRLAAYVVLRPFVSPQDLRLREFLASRLPEYMVPTDFVRLDSMPVTANGKWDRAALPLPNEGNSLREEAWIGARTPVEERLIALLKPLLQIEKIGVEDNFFLLGGHSLLGTQLIERISQTFGVEMTLLSLFDHPTVAAIAMDVERQILAKAEALEAGKAQDGISSLSGNA